jgi:hypothetical protein
MRLTRNSGHLVAQIQRVNMLLRIVLENKGEIVKPQSLQAQRSNPERLGSLWIASLRPQ